MYKNVANQHIAIFAWNSANGTPKTGDAANITAWVGKDGAALLGSDDLNPVEVGLGVYMFDVSQAESNCDLLVWVAESSTADVDIRPKDIYTQNLDSFKATGFSTHNASDVKTAMEEAGSKLTDCHDEALGKWDLDHVAKTLTYYRKGATSEDVGAILGNDMSDSDMMFGCAGACQIATNHPTFEAGTYIKIDDEICSVLSTLCEVPPTGFGEITLQERGLFGTTPASHLTDVTVYKYSLNGGILQVFDLPTTTDDVPTFIGRTPVT